MAKTAMAPLGAALLGILWLFRRRAWGRQVRRLYLAAGLFLAVFFGYSAWLSADQERLTFGDSGRLNYAWEVVWDPEIKWFGWSGEVEGSGTPAHGPRVLGDGPRLLDYSGAFPDATAPMWFEPSYWNAGLKAPFRLERQLEALYSETAKLAAFLWDQRFTVAAGFICVLLAWRSAAARLPLRWLAIWAVVPLAMYCTVFMAYRYVYPFWILLWIALALPEPLEPRKAKAHTLLLLVSAALLFAETGRRVLYDIRHPTNVDRGAVAEHLAESGIPPHARLAQIGLAGDVSYLRRIPARVTHLIPVRDLQSFEEASADRLRRLLETLQGEDVDALFAGERPAGLLLNAWRPGPSNYVFVLPVEDALAALPEADQMRGDQSP